MPRSLTLSQQEVQKVTMDWKEEPSQTPDKQQITDSSCREGFSHLRTLWNHLCQQHNILKMVCGFCQSLFRLNV